MEFAQRESAIRQVSGGLTGIVGAYRVANEIFRTIWPLSQTGAPWHDAVSRGRIVCRHGLGVPEAPRSGQGVS
jgi:hypothetical protein